MAIDVHYGFVDSHERCVSLAYGFIEFYIVITIYRNSCEIGEGRVTYTEVILAVDFVVDAPEGELYLHCTRPQSTLVLRRLTGSVHLGLYGSHISSGFCGGCSRGGVVLTTVQDPRVR